MSEILQDTFYRERFIQQASSSTISLWTKTEMFKIYQFNSYSGPKLQKKLKNRKK